MKIEFYRVTNAGNLIFYTEGNTPHSTPVQHIDTLSPDVQDRSLADAKIRHRYYDPVAVPSSARKRLAGMGIETVGDFVAALDDPTVRNVISSNACYGWRDYLSEIYDALREIPALINEDYVPPVVLNLPRATLSPTPRNDQDRELWESLDKSDQKEIIAGLMETMEGVFFDLLQDQAAQIYEEKIRQAENQLAALRNQAQSFQ